MLVNVNDINWYEYLLSFGLVEPTKNKRKRIKQRIINVFTAFDIETTSIWCNPNKQLYDVHSFMYIWTFTIEEYTVQGRTWEEFFDWLNLLKRCIEKLKINYSLSDLPIMVCFIHNLAFEWTFFSGVYPFKNEEIFFRDVRKPIYCRMFDIFEFRCSYIQSNLSLSALCKQTGVKEKLSGQKFDYDKIRFPWIELTPFELEYTLTDTESLVQAMKYRVIKGGDTLETMPLTSTGYVRRECKEALKDYYMELRSLKPDEEQYRLLRKCARGGNTHANMYKVGKIISNVQSFDISSSYPTQQLTQLFPMKPFKWLDIKNKTARKRIERIFMFIGLNYAVVGLYQFKNIRLKKQKEPIPYISLSKCDAVSTDDETMQGGLELLVDNGRVLQAGYMEIALTEIDLKIVLDQYTYDEFDCIEAMVAEKDMLPVEYREVIQSYFNNKTGLKGDDSEDGLYMYMKSKNLLNAVFGMSMTDPVHTSITYDPLHTIEKKHDGDFYKSDYDDYTKKELEKLLKNAPFPYQWGVYTTSLGRAQLQSAIKLCGDKLVYVDTDSVKVEGDINISVLNDKLKQKAVNNKAFATDKKGVVHYIGLWENDGFYDQFITQGAKRYAYIVNGKMGITVAGVSKKINEETGVSFAVEELGTLENFHPDIFNDEGDLIKEGMTWHKAGGTISVYNDNDDFYYTDKETGRKVHITKNVAIVPGTYKMTYAKDYRLLLNEIQLYGDYRREHS